jgi:hypothetical protein
VKPTRRFVKLWLRSSEDCFLLSTKIARRFLKYGHRSKKVRLILGRNYTFSLYAKINSLQSLNGYF